MRACPVPSRRKPGLDGGPEAAVSSDGRKVAAAGTRTGSTRTGGGGHPRGKVEAKGRGLAPVMEGRGAERPSDRRSMPGNWGKISKLCVVQDWELAWGGRNL
jgi:hypothetical protein